MNAHVHVRRAAQGEAPRSFVWRAVDPHGLMNGKILSLG